MRDQFEQYLIQRGYKQYTPSGNPSTVYDYCHRIDAVCKWENTTWCGLAQQIGQILTEYEVGGSKESFGSKSHNAVRNALRAFYAFTQVK